MVANGVDGEIQENVENIKPLSIRERIKNLAAARPLNLTAVTDSDGFLELEPEKKVEKEDVKSVLLDRATQVLFEKANIKPTKEVLAVVEEKKAPTKSPKFESKLSKMRREMAEKMRNRRIEEQSDRFAVFNADNELEVDPEEEEEEEMEMDDSDNDGGDEGDSAPATGVQSVQTTPKRKIRVDEDEEIVDDDNSDNDNESGSDADDEAEDAESDPETDNDNVADLESDSEDEAVKAKSQARRRAVLSDDEADDDDDVPMATDTQPVSPGAMSPQAANFDDDRSLFGRMSFAIPACPSQVAEPDLLISQASDTQPEARVTTLEDELVSADIMDLCSGVFGSSLASQMSSARFELQSDAGCSESAIMDLPNALSAEDASEPVAKKAKLFSDDTADALMIYDSDEDIYCPVAVPQKPATQVRLFDSEDEDEEGNDAEITGKASPVKPDKSPVPSWMDDVFSREEESTTGTGNGVIADVVDDDEVTNDEFDYDKPIQKRYAVDDDDDDDDEEESENEDNNLGGDPINMLKQFVDEEASLSGDDMGSDIDEALLADEYESELGDDDDINMEEVRENLVKQTLKHEFDEEERRLIRIQEALFVDSDLHGDGLDRSFRNRMNHQISDEDWQKLVKLNPALANIKDDDEDEESENEEEKAEKARLKAIKVQNFKKEVEDAVMNDNAFDDILNDPMFKVSTAESKRSKKIGKSSTTFSALSCDSLLRSSGSLGVLLKEVQAANKAESSKPTTGAFFTAVSQQK